MFLWGQFQTPDFGILPDLMNGESFESRCIEREIQALIDSGLKFSIEVNGWAVLVWMGDYLRDMTPTATVASLDQAVEWLHQHRQLTVSRRV